jgi:hypothetical protein
MELEYLRECTKIYDNCLYTAEAHHIIALRNKRHEKLFQLVPAIVAALMTTLAAGQIVPSWVGYATAIAAVLTAITTVLDPSKNYYEHLSAARAFTALKQDADSLMNTFGNFLDGDALGLAVKQLHDRYNDLIAVAPPTDDSAFGKAQARIQLKKVHEPDTH